MRHLIHKDKSKNLGLIIGKSGIAVGDMPWNLCFITNTTPENILDYIYATLYSTAYREKSKEQLKYHFPRVPYPSSSEYFYKMSELGRKLRYLHLMDASEKWNTKNIYPFKGDGSSVVVKPYWKDSRIYINDNNYFDNVSQDIWSYYIGGYQIAEKWLKDRKGTELDFHEIVHYSKILYVIAHTLLITQAIDEVYKKRIRIFFQYTKKNMAKEYSTDLNQAFP